MAAEGALAVSGGTDVYPAPVGRPLSRPLVDKYFTGTCTTIEGVGLAEVAEECVRRHRDA